MKILIQPKFHKTNLTNNYRAFKLKAKFIKQNLQKQQNPHVKFVVFAAAKSMAASQAKHCHSERKHERTCLQHVFICSSRSSHVCASRYRTCGNFEPRKQIYHCNQNKHLCHSSCKNSSAWLYLPPCTKTLCNNECSPMTQFYDNAVDDILLCLLYIFWLHYVNFVLQSEEIILKWSSLKLFISLYLVNKVMHYYGV